MNEESYNPVAKAMGKLTEDLIRVAASEQARAVRQEEEREKEGKEFTGQKHQLNSDLQRAESHRKFLLEKMRDIQIYLVTVRKRMVRINETDPGPGKRTNLARAMNMNLPDALIEIDTCLGKAQKGLDGPDREF